MADHQEATVTLPSVPASVSAARRQVMDVLATWGLPDGAAPDGTGPDGTDLADTIRLILSELATNAVQHTRGQSPTFTVELRLDREERLRVGVTDSHPRHPRRLPVDGRQDSGRGMVIVRALTAEYGGRVVVTPTADGGKTVWITLPWTVSVR
ncbi:ATP-binding protein [Streptomyces sp. UNOB3_S3]|uniref:ATP-binding protein n=1 Tax=Streptomyces sp. UNOB3_S3 TaxID=2871682 RepID=UPI001E53DFC6|nr:ATP-binding protein [Streptomyces sp. UNOB3_S3]MCC3777823.1 ATP-binding protein [Streptomyces sp. UNOB3_S3]